MSIQNPITFHRAETSDLESILSLCRRVAEHLPSSGWCSDYPNREILSADLARGDLYRVLLGGRWLALMQIRPWADFLAGEEEPDITGWNPAARRPCALGRFCVAPEIQGRGMARAIVTAAMDYARELGYDCVRFHAADFNHIAVHLYQAMGFHLAGTVEEYGMRFLCYEMLL